MGKPRASGSGGESRRWSLEVRSNGARVPGGGTGLTKMVGMG
jgi:hypothetical protein